MKKQNNPAAWGKYNKGAEERKWSLKKNKQKQKTFNIRKPKKGDEKT